MFYEIREYRILDGKRDEWVKFMESDIIPFQYSKGMVIIASFESEEEEDLYVWIRRFESEEEKVKLYEAVYETDHWKNVITPVVTRLLDRSNIVVRRFQSTPKSVV